MLRTNIPTRRHRSAGDSRGLRARLRVEQLEGRVLLSADLPLGDPPDTDGTQVLYFVDFTAGRPEPYRAAFTALGITPTVATSHPDFNARLAQGGWDLVVFLQQGDADTTWVTPMIDWINGGGKAIACTWIFRVEPTEAQRAAAAFGARYTGTENGPSVNQTVVHPIWEGISNPMALANPGWFTFANGLEATTGTAIGKYPNEDAAIVVGNGDRTVLNGWLSDVPANPTERVRVAQNEVSFLLGQTGAAGPIIIRHTPTHVIGGLESIRVTFDRPIMVDTFTTDDVPYFEGPVGLIPILAVEVVPGTGNR
jgi:hypothetical protein